MADVTAALVKELRERTGVGIMECKKALIKAKNNIELAIDNMRKSGQTNAVKKSSRITAEGIILTKIAQDSKYGVIIELNCETDFVAKDNHLKIFGEKVITAALDERINDLDVLKAKFEEQRSILVTQVCENINIRRIKVLTGEMLGSYLHGIRIGVIVATSGAEAKLIKQIAMHIAASKPEYIDANDIPVSVISREHQVQLDIAIQCGKTRNIAEKIVAGRMHKFAGQVALTRQNFIMDPNKTVGQLLNEYNAKVNTFIRFEVGEGIKKTEVDFATEVAIINNQFL